MTRHQSLILCLLYSYCVYSFYSYCVYLHSFHSYRFKFSTVTTGEFRDYFVSFFYSTSSLLQKDTPATAASIPAPTTSKSAKKNNKKSKNKNKEKTKDISSSSSRSDVNNNSKIGNEHNTASFVTPSTVSSIKMKEILDKVLSIDWDTIFTQPGLPVHTTSFKNSLSAEVESLAELWVTLSSGRDFSSPPIGCSKADLDKWSVLQKNIFLEVFLNHIKYTLSTTPLTPEEVFPLAFLELLDRTYEFSVTKNCEIMLRWHQICIVCEAHWILPRAVEFISSQGRMKYVRPLYRLLRGSMMGRQIAIDTFEAKKDS